MEGFIRSPSFVMRLKLSFMKEKPLNIFSNIIYYGDLLLKIKKVKRDISNPSSTMASSRAVPSLLSPLDAHFPVSQERSALACSPCFQERTLSRTLHSVFCEVPLSLPVWTVH